MLQQGTPKQSATSRSTTVKRLIKLRLSKHDSTSTSGVNSSYGYTSKSLVSAPKQKPALCRKTVLFHKNLVETNKRPKCTGKDKHLFIFSVAYHIIITNNKNHVDPDQQASEIATGFGLTLFSSLSENTCILFRYTFFYLRSRFTLAVICCLIYHWLEVSR